MENNQITTKALADKIHMSQRKVKENLRKLKDKGVVKRIGTARGGYWKVVQDLRFK